MHTPAPTLLWSSGLHSVLRRLVCSAAVLVATLAGGASALAASSPEVQTECSTLDTTGIVTCQAGLDARTITRIKLAQERSQWCWAASVAMILAFHGQVIGQDEIVSARYGAVADLPATSMDDMTQALTRLPADTQALPIRVTTQTARPTARLHLNNRLILDEMLAHRPILVVRASHAMVLVHVRYERFPNGAVRVTAGTVIDPAPGAGVRHLARDELGLAWFAAVRPATAAPEAPAAPNWDTRWNRDDSLRAGVPLVVAGTVAR